jgi:arylsulfatase
MSDGARRNVVLVTFDSLRADHCSYTGYRRDTTPNLDAMAAEGLTFENAVAPASRTNPSMAATFTGEPMVFRDAVSDPAVATRHTERHGTIAESMADRGYTTGAFNPNAYASRYYGFDRGFDDFEDFLFSTDRYRTVFEKHLAESGLYGTLRNVRNFVRREEVFRTWDSYIDDVETWVRNREDPFFLWLFSLEPHFPYLAPRGYRHDSTLLEQYYYNWVANRLIDDQDPDVADRTWQQLVDLYDDSIRYADALLGELRDRLAEFDPVFVVFADHGESFGEHGLYGHFYPTVYEENLDVPLVVSGVEADTTVDAPFPLTELPRVVTDVADGTFSPGSVDPPGWALATDYDGRTDRKVTAVKTDRWKLIVTRHDEATVDRELYDLDSDPDERTDRSGAIESGDDTPQTVLGDVERHRLAHERETLAIRDAVDTIAADRPV